MKDKDRKLFEAIKTNNVEGVRAALEDGADAKAVNENGWNTLLDAIVYDCPLEIIELLLKYEANVNKVSPLIKASVLAKAILQEYSLPTIKCLVDAGADVLAVDNGGYSVEWYTEEFGGKKVRDYIKQKIEEKTTTNKEVQHD